MKHEINIDQLAEILCSRAREANREIIRYYGAENADMRSRSRFLSQLQLVRDLGIPADLSTNEDSGKELYTALAIAGSTYTI